MRIAMIGTGYVGLVTGACFAQFGNDVICVDIDAARIAGLRAGQMPFYEPGLETMVNGNAAAKRLRFETDIRAAVEHCEVAFLAVGTPQADDGSADLTYIMAAARQVAEAAPGPRIVAIKSTVPVGTGDKVQALVDEVCDHRLEVVSNPEFLKEGDAVNDFLKPDRVIVGTDSPDVRSRFADLYAPYMRTRARLLFMDRRSSELSKYAANGILATKISFMNEISRLCEQVGADVTDVRMGIGSDQRIGHQFLFPGVGFGGSCFPKDVSALCYSARENGTELQILQAVLDVNESQKAVLVDKVKRRFGDLKGRRFGVWGLSFKPGTDDMREAPSLTIIEGLLAAGATVAAHDPATRESAGAVLGDRIDFVEDPYEACEGSDALLVVTEWSIYRNPDMERVRDLLKQPVVFDGRNLYRRTRMKALGFEHYAIGRPPVNAPA